MVKGPKGCSAFLLDAKTEEELQLLIRSIFTDYKISLSSTTSGSVIAIVQGLPLHFEILVPRLLDGVTLLGSYSLETIIRDSQTDAKRMKEAEPKKTIVEKVKKEELDHAGGSLSPSRLQRRNFHF